MSSCSREDPGKVFCVAILEFMSRRKILRAPKIVFLLIGSSETLSITMGSSKIERNLKSRFKSDHTKEECITGYKMPPCSVKRFLAH